MQRQSSLLEVPLSESCDDTLEVLQAGMPLSQISLLTGGTWPWAFGPPLFLPPPLPPLPPLALTFGNTNMPRLSAQAFVGTGGLGMGFGAPNFFNVNGGVNGIGFFR